MGPAPNELGHYPGPHAGPLSIAARPEREGLIDVLDRVLDKGVVIAGDIRINLLDIELLTIKVRLLIASADKARELGIDWWSRDPHLSSKASGDSEKENKALRERVERLEAQLKSLTDGGAGKRQATASNGGAQGRRNS
jgi:hypothetical protein